MRTANDWRFDELTDAQRQMHVQTLMMNAVSEAAAGIDGLVVLVTSPSDSRACCSLGFARYNGADVPDEQTAADVVRGRLIDALRAYADHLESESEDL